MTSLLLLAGPQPYRLRVGALTVTVRPGTALEWLSAVGDERFAEMVVPGMLASGDALEVLRALAVEEIGAGAVVSAAREALGAAGGMPWWKVWRLAHWAADGAPAGYWGDLVLRGVDPGRVSMAAWCAAVWALVVRGRDGTDLLKVRTAFDLPPVGEVDVSAWAMDPSDFPART